MTCPDCERYKKSAAMWRNFAYESSGHPLPWKPEELWQGLTDEEIVGMTCECVDDGTFDMDCAIDFARAIETKLKEKNG